MAKALGLGKRTTSVRFRASAARNLILQWFMDTGLRLCPSLPTETLKCLSSLPTLMQKSGRSGGTAEREIVYLSLHCHHQNDSCIKMGGDEIHFNVSVGSDGQSLKTVSTNHNLFEEKGEPKWYRTEVLPRLTSLTPYR